MDKEYVREHKETFTEAELLRFLSEKLADRYGVKNNTYVKVNFVWTVKGDNIEALEVTLKERRSDS